MKYHIQVQHWIEYDDGYPEYIDLEIEAKTADEALAEARKAYPYDYWASWVVDTEYWNRVNGS